MVEVDVFWAYGFGASLALASGRQLAGRERPFESRYGVQTILFLALCWAPTGMLLLIRHPSWETMQAAENFYSMSPFLILAFGITNVTQGMLGFWVGYRLMKAGRYYLANLNWMLGYFGMFFILVYGWDGLGYDRFFYDRDMLPGSPAWTPGAGTGGAWGTGMLAAWHFLTSGVAMTLYTDGVYLLPPFAFLMYRWYAEGLRAEGHEVTLTGFGVRMLAVYLAAVFVVSLGSAVFSAVVVNYVGALLGVGEHVARARAGIPAATPMHVLSYFTGLPLALAILWLTVLRPGGLVHRMLAIYCIGEAAGMSSGKNAGAASKPA